MLTVPCATPTGSIARTASGPAIPATVSACRPCPRSAASSPSSPMARWVRSWRPSPSRDEWGVRDLARATGHAAQRRAPDPPRHGPPGLLAPADEPGRFRVGPTSLGSARSSPSTSTSAAWAGRSWSGRRRQPARPSSSPSTTRPAASSGPSTRPRPPSDPLHLGVAARLERPPPRLSRARASWPSCRPTSRRAILDRLPDPVPGRTGRDQGQLRAELEGAAARLRRQPRRALSRAPSASPRRSATRAAGSSATSSRPGRTTAPTRKEAAAGAVVRAAADDLSRRLGWTGAGSGRRTAATPRTPTMTDPIRIGIVGAGRIVASEHVPRFRAIDGVELVGVANRSEDSSRRAADELGLRRLPVVGGARRGPGASTRSWSAPGRCFTPRPPSARSTPASTF